MTQSNDVEYAIEVNEHATAIYEMLQDGGPPERAMAILMMATSMIVYNTLNDEGEQIDADKEISKFARKIKSIVKHAIENDANPADLAYNTENLRETVAKQAENERAPIVSLDIAKKLNEFMNPDVALRILAAATAHVLTTRFHKENDSVEAYNKFHSVIGQTVAASEKMGYASWTHGTAH